MIRYLYVIPAVLAAVLGKCAASLLMLYYPLAFGPEAALFWQIGFFSVPIIAIVFAPHVFSGLMFIWGFLMASMGGDVDDLDDEHAILMFHLLTFCMMVGGIATLSGAEDFGLHLFRAIFMALAVIQFANVWQTYRKFH